MEQKDVLKALQRDHAAELKLAAERLKGTARHTEIIPSPVLSEMTGHEILLKPENLQVTGSFKIRGAYNKIASLTEEQIAHGIVTASAGNHAQGVAYAARERGAKATICMPQITPPLKVDATKAYGADVVLYGDVFDESAAHAAELADKEGMIYVPPFDDYEVICGQGTIGLEILEDVPNVTDVVVPLGGGGLGAGVALAIKTFKPEVRVIGAIPEGSPAWKDSLAAGRVSPADHVVTSAEGVAVKHPGALPFALINEFLADLVTVTERDINEMILLMLEKHKLVVEAAGAVSLAALEHLNLRSRKFAAATGPHVVVPIMSGGNIDTVTMGAVIQKGMIARGRIMNFEVELPDTPGQLVKVATLLADTTTVSARRTVNCGIGVSGKLREPKLSFSIEVPDLDPTTKSRVESALNTDDKVQRQFLSLLISGSFMPEEQSGVVNNTNMLYSNVAEIMAGQLNNILQKLDIPLDLGLNYQSSESGTNIFDVAVSTQLFNNRVIVNGNVGNREYAKSSSSSDGDVVGNLDIEIKLDKSGQLRLNLFSHSADDYTTYLDNTQRNGVGIAYQREFNTLKEFFRNLFTGRKKREQRAAAYDNGPRELKRISIFKDGAQGESKKK